MNESTAWKPLDEDSRLIEGLLMVDRRRWPGWRTLWLWLQQRRPRDYPVIVREGTITAVARAVDDAGLPVIESRDVVIRNWSFSHSLLPSGAMDTHDLIDGLLDRRLATVTFPDGHQRQMRLRYSGDDQS